MGTVTIDLDEFRIDDDLGIYVYGEADLTYEQSGDSYYFTVVEITIAPYHAGGSTYSIKRSILKDKPNSRDAMLFHLIADAVEEDREEIIARKIEEDEEDRRDAWLSDAYDRMKDDRATGDLP